MTTFHAVGFDVGETLIHYEGVPLNWQALYPQALTCVAKTCRTSLEADQLTGAIEILARYNTRLYPRQHEVSANQIFTEILAFWQLPVQQHLNSAKDAFFSSFQRKMHPYKETLSTLRQLKALDLKIGVLTDVPYGMERTYLERDLQMLAPYLDTVVTSAEVGYRKPDPRGYLALAQRLQVQADQMLFAGNEAKDISGANAVGLFSVLVNRDGHPYSYGEKVRISRLDQILSIFR